MDLFLRSWSWVVSGYLIWECICLRWLVDVRKCQYNLAMIEKYRDWSAIIWHFCPCHFIACCILDSELCVMWRTHQFSEGDCKSESRKENHQSTANANKYPTRWCFPMCYTCCGNSKNPQKVWITNREGAVEPKEWLWHLDKSLSNSYKNKHPGALRLHCLSCGDAYIKVPNENDTFSKPGRGWEILQRHENIR